MLSLFQSYFKVPRKAYLVGFTHFSLEFHNNILPVLFPVLIDKLSLSYEQVGIITMVAAMAGTLTQPFFGYLSDRFEPRWLIIGSIAWIGFWQSFVGFAPSFISLLIFVAIAKLGSAGYHPAGAALSRAMAGEQQRGTSMAVFSVSGNLGYALSPIIASLIVADWFGLQGTMTYVFTGIVVSSILFFFSGQLAIPKETEARPTPLETVETVDDSKKSSSALALALVVMIVASRSLFQGSLNTFLPELLQIQGLSLQVSGQWFAVLLVSVGLGSMTGGPASDKVGAIPVILVSMLLMSPLFWVFTQIDGSLRLVTLSLIGITIGAGFPVAILMAQEVWPQGPALASSLVMGLGWLPSGFGTWMIGRMADKSGLPEAISMLVFVPLLGALSALAFWLHERKRGGEIRV